MKKLLALLLAGSALVACSSNKAPAATPIASAPVETPAPMASAPVASAPAVSNYNSVFFGFNKYDINADYADLVKSDANYLATNSSAKVQVQGNTDDVGSIEYNLSLGQKRADAVKKALIAGGAKKSQIEATSNGKLKAKFANDASETKAMNRRADIMFKAEQPAGYSVDSKGLPWVDGNFYNGTVTQGVQ